MTRYESALGFAHEYNGQFYSLDLQDEIDGIAMKQREDIQAAVDAAEKTMQTAESSAEHTASITELAHYTDQLTKLTDYCIARGLYESLDEDIAA